MEKTYKTPHIIYLEAGDKLPMDIKDLPICHHNYEKSEGGEDVYHITFEDGEKGTIYGETFAYNLYHFIDTKDFRHTYKKIKKAVFALYVYLKYNTIIPEDEF